MPGTNTFSTLLGKLNPAQQKAVTTIEGPVMVIAGPGTGKTQVLTARIAQILEKTDTEPSAILALTFTESAAKNMRERLVKLIGKTGYYVQISTFHAFCRDVIATHPEFFPIERESEPLSDLERFELLESIFRSLELEHIKPLNTPFLYIKDAIKGISNLKREGVSVAEFETMVREWGEALEADKDEMKKAAWAQENKQQSRNRELVAVYREYEKRLRETKRFDFDDMISLVVTAFEQHELLLREYQENLHYFLVDEYQDTNSAQNTVVDLLASYWGEKANVFVVGDPNQAIYRFQGASVENMLGFLTRYPQAEVVTLTTGYRSPQKLYDLADKLIAENHLRLDSAPALKKISTKLTSVHAAGRPVELLGSPSQVLEAVQVAEKIKSLLNSGTPAEEIAVLYRKNTDRAVVAETFDSWGIPYEIEGGGDALREESIQQLLTLLQVIYDIRSGAETEALYEILHYDWILQKFKLDPLVIMKVGRAAGKAHVPFLELAEAGAEAVNPHNGAHALTDTQLKPLQDFLTTLKKWSSLDASQTFTAWFEMMLKESGYLEWLLSQDGKIFLVLVLNSVFGEIKKMVAHNHRFKLADFLRALQLIEEHKLTITIDDLNVRRKAVHLSTVHKAKGREWEYVFLVQCVDKKWGNNRQRDLIKLPAAMLAHTDLTSKERNEDERRIFYVALTRAKKQAFVSYPETFVSEGQTRDSVPSMFLTEIETFDAQGKLMARVDQPDLPEKADEYLVKLLQPSAPRLTTRAQKDYFLWLLEHFRWSTTALDVYLKDPEQFINEKLLNIPKAKAVQFAFGSAVHAALQDHYTALQETGAFLTLPELLARFESALKREVLTPDDFRDRLKFGQKILTAYHADAANRPAQPLLIERFFGGGRQKVVLDGISLTGRVDRIDWLDQEKKLVKVIDYKTGKAKSANQIIGKVGELTERERALPEGIRGQYKRQLVFYKLLTELDHSFPYTVAQGEFEFIQPTDSGTLVRRPFELIDREVADLKTLIKTVVSELKARWQ